MKPQPTPADAPEGRIDVKADTTTEQDRGEDLAEKLPKDLESEARSDIEHHGTEKASAASGD